MIIIGITGTLGAGKGTVVEYLIKEHGFKHYSVRKYLTEIIKNRGLPVNRDSMVEVANGLRNKYGPSHMAEALYAKAEKDKSNCIIESIRTPGEIDALKSKGAFFLLAVDADPKVRYRRIQERKSATDMVSFEEFLADEQREMESDDPNKQNLSACISRADFTIQNNSSFQELHQKIKEVLDAIDRN